MTGPEEKKSPDDVCAERCPICREAGDPGSCIKNEGHYLDHRCLRTHEWR